MRDQLKHQSFAKKSANQVRSQWILVKLNFVGVPSTFKTSSLKINSLASQQAKLAASIQDKLADLGNSNFKPTTIKPLKATTTESTSDQTTTTVLSLNTF